MDGPLVPLGTRIPDALHHRLKMVCAQLRKDIQGFVREALEEKLERAAEAYGSNNVVSLSVSEPSKTRRNYSARRRPPVK